MNPPFRLADDDVYALGMGECLVQDGALSNDQVLSCAADLDRLHAAELLRPAAMGRATVRDPDLRGDHTTWASEVDLPLVGLRPLFEEVRVELNLAAWLGLAVFSVQLAIYPAGGTRYARHRDAFAREPSRRATAIVYLNPSWTPSCGGCLRIHPPSGTRDVEPLGGRLVVFLADQLEHEVLPTFEVRRAATAWYRGPEAVPLV